MSFTTRMTEQFIQTMYQKTTNTTKAAQNKTANKKADVMQQQKAEQAAVYEGSANQAGRATYSKPVAINQKNDRPIRLL